MFKQKMGFMILAAVLGLWGLSALSEETSLLSHEADWHRLSAKSKDISLKASRHFSKGEFTKAVRAYDKFLAECDPNSELYADALERQFCIGQEFLAGRKRPVLGVFRIKGYATGRRIMRGVKNWADKAIMKIDAAASETESAEEKNKFDKTITNLERISIDADVEMARSYEKRGQFELAYFMWADIFDKYDKQLQASSWPTGEIGKDALLGMARCKLAAYEGPKYDASGLIGATLSQAGPYDSARSCYEEFRAQYPIDANAIPIAQILKGRCYEEFKSQYPEDANEVGVGGILEEIEEEEARKQLHIARYYQRTYRAKKDGGEINPANLYFQMIWERWPNSKAARTASEMLIKNLGGKEIKKKNEEAKP